MWSRVRVDQEELLKRCADIASQGDPRVAWQSLNERLATLRFEVGTEVVELYMWRGEEFDLVLNLRFGGKWQRYMVCFGVDGQVDPQFAVDRFIEGLLEFGHAHGIDRVYGFEPRELRSPLLRQIYDAAAKHPQVNKELLSEMPDQRLYRLRYRDAVVAEAARTNSIDIPVNSPS